MVSILKQAKADKKELTKEVEKMNAVFDEHNAKIKSLERTSKMKKSELEKIIDETARTRKIKCEEREGFQKHEKELSAAR